MLNERGVQPETLPVAEDIAKLKRKLDGDAKKILKDTRKKTFRNQFVFSCVGVAVAFLLVQLVPRIPPVCVTRATSGTMGRCLK